MNEKKAFIWSEMLQSTLFDPATIDTMEKAIFWYGTKHQLNKCKEECLELLTAIHNLNQPSPDYVKNENNQVVADEIADVLITAIQAAKIIGMDEVADRIKFKISRLDNRIEKQMTLKNERG